MIGSININDDDGDDDGGGGVSGDNDRRRKIGVMSNSFFVWHTIQIVVQSFHLCH